MRTAFRRTVGFAEKDPLFIGTRNQPLRHRSPSAQIETQRIVSDVSFFKKFEKVVNEGCRPMRPGASLAANEIERFARRILLLQRHAAPKQERRYETVIETGRMIERRGHPHAILRPQIENRKICAFGKQDVVMRMQDHFRRSRGTGSSENACNLIGP